MIVFLKGKATQEDIEKASEEYKSYIKVTIDIEKEIVAIGGEYHYDAEQKMLRMGSHQKDIWGGGVDLLSKAIDTNAMINVRVRENYSTEICDESIRKKFIKITKQFLSDYVSSNLLP